MIKLLTTILLFLPFLASANDKPSMTSMWLELFFLIIMLVSLKVAYFSNTNKLIIFSTYVMTGIFTQTIWVPVLLWIVMYFIFRNIADDEIF